MHGTVRVRLLFAVGLPRRGTAASRIGTVFSTTSIASCSVAFKISGSYMFLRSIASSAGSLSRIIELLEADQTSAHRIGLMATCPRSAGEASAAEDQAHQSGSSSDVEQHVRVDQGHRPPALIRG